MLKEFKPVNVGTVCAPQTNPYTEAKAPYHFGKPADFTEIHDYLLIQLYPISLSSHLTVL